MKKQSYLLLLFVSMNFSCSKVFYDQFVSDKNKWTLYKDSDARITFDKGMNIEQNSSDKSAFITKDFGTAKISEVECSINHLSGATGVGLIWGFKEEATHNRFIITTRDQEYYCQSQVNNEDEVIKTWTKNEAIARDNGTNVLKMKQNGTSIEFYANGKLLFSQENSDLSSKIGIFLGSTAGSKCKINYFKVVKI